MEEASFVPRQAENVTERLAADDLLDQIASFFIDNDVGFVDGSEQIMKIAHDLLIGPDQ